MRLAQRLQRGSQREHFPLRTSRCALYTIITIPFFCCCCCFFPPPDLNDLGQPVLLKDQGLICKQRVAFNCELPSTQITLELFQKQTEIKTSKVSVCGTASPGSLFYLIEHAKSFSPKCTVINHAIIYNIPTVSICYISPLCSISYYDFMTFEYIRKKTGFGLPHCELICKDDGN